MKHIFLHTKLIILSCFFSILLFSCEDSDNDVDDKKTEAPAITQKVNNFIYSEFSDIYLWSSTIPKNIDIKYENSPEKYFDKLKYTDDGWSRLIEEKSTRASDELEYTFGYEPFFYYFSDNTHVYAIVGYVYPNSPADKAGLKRGDILMRLNGANMTRDNYMQLVYGSSISVEFGEFDAKTNSIKLTGKKVSMTAEQLYLDPVHTWKVIEKGNKKIGYLFYTGYLKESHDKLVEVFSALKKEGITEMVLDLRYNPGGYAVTAQHLSSILAPASAIASKTLFLEQRWNDRYMASFSYYNQDVNQYFYQDIPVNMDLKNLYVLTTSRTASASEATITGLEPYMNVIQIGGTTHGKYCGAIPRQPWTDQKETELDPEISNWSMEIIVFKYANADGYTDFKTGLIPDYEVEDDLDYQIGDENDPLLAKAIELITGQRPVRSIVKTKNNVPYYGDLDWRKKEYIVDYPVLK